MSALTYEIGARTTGLKQATKEAKEIVKDLRRNTREQFSAMAKESAGAAGGKGGFGAELKANLFGSVTKANLATQAIMKTAGAIKDGVNAVGDMVDASDQLGVSAESFSRLQRVMEGAGVETENLRKVFLQLNAARSAAIDGDEKMVAKFAEFGITAEKLQSMDLEATLLAVGDGIAAISDPSEAASKSLDLIGTKNAKLLGALKMGGAEIKKQMGEVNAVSERSARSIDDASDKLGAMWGAAKAKLTNNVGNIIDAFNKGVSASKEAVSGPEKTEMEAAFEKKDQEEAQKAAEAKKLEALRVAAANKQALEDSKKAVEIAKEHTEAERDRVELLRESFSLQQRYLLAVDNVVTARKKYDEAQPGIEKEQAGADLAKARAQFEAERQKKVERFGLPLSERKRIERADRDAQRAQDKGERVFRAQERDRIDRDFRAGRINEKTRDRMLEELRVKKGPEGMKEGLPEQTLKEMQQIRGQLEKFNEKIGPAV